MMYKTSYKIQMSVNTYYIKSCTTCGKMHKENLKLSQDHLKKHLKFIMQYFIIVQQG